MSVLFFNMSENNFKFDINELNKLAAKPSLEYDIIKYLNYYGDRVNDANSVNYAEAGLFIQACTKILEKRIDLLHKAFLEYCTSLCSLMSDSSNDQKELEKEKKVKNVKHNSPKRRKIENNNEKDKSIPEEKVKRTNTKKAKNTDEITLENLQMLGIPSEIIEKLFLSDFNLNDTIKECLSKIGPSHPLYSALNNIGDKISRTKNFITYNDVSLSGKSWNALYILESLLAKFKSNQSANTDSGNKDLIETNNTVLVEIEPNTEKVCNTICEKGNSDYNSETNCAVNNITQVNTENVDITIGNNIKNYSYLISKELRVNLFRLPNIKEFSKTIEDKAIAKRTDLKELRINLFKLPLEKLLKKSDFRLSAVYIIKEMRKMKSKENIRKNQIVRKEIQEINNCKKLISCLKRYDLEQYENFCYSYNVKEGLCSPIPAKVVSTRKSLDSRSEVSYGYPVTPESGRFSLTFQTDSEFDFDSDHDRRQMVSRADSGIVLSPLRDSFLSETEDPEQNETMHKLKEIFPNTFADASRAELLKNICRPPEEENKSESYLQWEKFINEKTANKKEFCIYDYGTNIMESFPSKSKENVMSFNSLVENKSVEDVCRLFVSSLELGFRSNIEIINESPGEVRSDSLKLKFLSDDRPDAELDHTFNDNIREITTSTPIGPISSKAAKRPRLDKT